MQLPANFEITLALKSALKRQRMTYRQVADKLGISEQTIKRLFREKDCSLSRLAEICDAIGISIYDLIEFAKHYNEPVFSLSKDQELYLSTHTSHFVFLFFLISDYSLNEIQDAYELTALDCFRFLRDLDRNGFIELGPNNQFKLLVDGKLLMKLHGPLHETVRHLNHLFLNYVVDRDGKDGVSFDSSFRRMSKSTLESLQSELYAVTKKYRKQAYQDEMVLPKEKLFPVKWTAMVANFEVCGAWPLSDKDAAP